MHHLGGGKLSFLFSNLMLVSKFNEKLFYHSMVSFNHCTSTLCLFVFFFFIDKLDSAFDKLLLFCLVDFSGGKEELNHNPLR